MAERVRVGVVGLSERGWATGAHLPALRALPEVELVALATTRQESADAAAARYGVPLAFGDSAALIEHPDVDLVAVSVKVPDHREPVLRALAAGKHVYCEWPLGVDVAEATELADAAERAGTCVAVGLQAREHPAVQRARELVREGYVGRLLSAVLVGATPVLGGPEIPQSLLWGLDPAQGLSVLTIPTGHSIDPLLFLTGELSELAAIVRTQIEEPVVAETGERVRRRVPDQLSVQGTLASGAILTIHFQGGTAARNSCELHLYGTDGTLLLTSADSIQRTEMKVGIAGTAQGSTKIIKSALTHQPFRMKKPDSSRARNNFRLIAMPR